MSVYIVRLPRDGNVAACMVGVYVADSIEALEAQVENACAAGLCEFALVPGGAMYGVWSQEPEADEFSTASDRMSEDWRELFFGPEPPRWQLLQDARWHSAAERHDALATARRTLALA